MAPSPYLGLIIGQTIDVRRMYAYQPHPQYGVLEDKDLVRFTAVSLAPKTVPGIQQMIKNYL